MRRPLAFLLALLSVCLLPLHAFAQAVVPPPSDPPLSTMTVLVAITCATAFLRSMAPQESWAHTKWGSLATTALGAVLAAAYNAISTNGLNGHYIAIAVLGAIAGLAGGVNPSALRGALVKSTGAALVLFALLPGCAHVSPNVQQYDAALSACLATNGVAAIPTLETQVLNILETGGTSATQIEQSIESAAIAAGGDAAILVANCAVQAWFDQHPVLPADIGQSITPSQGAARLFLAKTGKGHAFRAPIGGGGR